MFGNSRVLFILLIVKNASDDFLVLQCACGGAECTQFSEDTGLD